MLNPCMTIKSNQFSGNERETETETETETERERQREREKERETESERDRAREDREFRAEGLRRTYRRYQRTNLLMFW